MGYTQNETCAEIRAENNSLVDSTCSCSDLKEASRVSDCLPQKLCCKNTEAKDNFASTSDGNKFRVLASNPGEKVHFEKSKETKPGS